MSKLTNVEIEQARWLVVALRAQITVLETELSITHQTFEMLDNRLHDLSDFIEKVYREKK